MWLAHERGVVNPYLEILLYRNRIQLATTDALYSDGDKYTPALAIINDDPSFLKNVNTALVLGVGLGSMVQIIRQRGYNPTFTLVELDKIVLKWAMEYLQKDKDAKIDPHCADASDFMAANKKKFDFLFIDIFDSRTVPDFASSQTFLEQCRSSVNPGGRLAFNYIMNNDKKWQDTIKTFGIVFPDHHIISNDINRIFIAKL